MQIIQRGAGTTSHKIDTSRVVFDPQIRKHFEDKYKGMEYVLNGGNVADMSGTGTYKPLDRIQDVAMYRFNMAEAKKHAEKGAPVTLTPEARNELYNKAKRLKGEICVGMVPKHELHPVKTKQIIVNGKEKTTTVVDNEIINNTKAVQRNSAWYKRNQPKMEEFRRIVRILDPDYPDPSKLIEKARPS